MKNAAREYEDISSELSIEKKNEFNQDIRVQPLNFEEIKLVSTHEFREEKKKVMFNVQLRKERLTWKQKKTMERDCSQRKNLGMLPEGRIRMLYGQEIRKI